MAVHKSTQDTILVVEDKADQWELINITLQEAIPGLKTYWASNGRQALDLLKKELSVHPPKLILLDWYLPTAADGQQLLQELRDPTSTYRLIPVTVFSHSSLTQDIHTAYELGCSSYMVKAPDYKQWLNYFQIMAEYWWNTVTVPKVYP